MDIKHGKLYTVKKLSSRHQDCKAVQQAVDRRTKSGQQSIQIQELYDVRWRSKPFSWSYTHEFKPNRRFFWHGTSRPAVEGILDIGFKVSNGGTLGSGVYATYHTNKSTAYARDRYLISVMIYAPNTLCVHPGKNITTTQFQRCPQQYDALEVRSGAGIGTMNLGYHEICVFDPARVIPRYIIKF